VFDSGTVGKIYNFPFCRNIRTLWSKGLSTASGCSMRSVTLKPTKRLRPFGSKKPAIERPSCMGSSRWRQRSIITRLAIPPASVRCSIRVAQSSSPSAQSSKASTSLRSLASFALGRNTFMHLPCPRRLPHRSRKSDASPVRSRLNSADVYRTAGACLI
jgi:hypothetical protein